MAFIKSIPEAEESVAAVLRRFPQHARLITELAEDLMRSGDCAFTSEQREIIGAYTSGTNNCTYCYDTHKATAEAFGVDPALLESMLQDLDSSAVDEALKPVLRFVRKLTESPSRMIQSDVDAIFDAGWSENDFHYTVMICALFNFMNRMIDGYGVENTAEGRQTRGRLLVDTGYRVVTDALDNR
ncbi:MAG: carboxymuconolactone decarboxylase family protein [Woeseiaceae bacterium]|nr:carboxymuconolactone decarboxylase family protein [Woeseiaceae bacterium]